MLRKAYTPLSMLFHALVLLVAGILLYSSAEATLRIILSVMQLLLWLDAIDTLLKSLTKRDEHRPSLGIAVLKSGLAVFVGLHPNVLPISFSLLFAIWIFINALGKLLYFVQLWQTESRGKIITFLQAAVYSNFAFGLWKAPQEGAVTLAELMGLYCLVSAFFYMLYDRYLSGAAGYGYQGQARAAARTDQAICLIDGAYSHAAAAYA